ncbi:uncharacterized protein K489DRAFT_314669, partial [Dissoconium aciculare CBS 342.82]|uniref:Amidase signature enzyme n=1 Tax=Dissoconium aciculare CBS 342.82 TaxID=1314786 RepID=A0A6J3MED9_9PEZI
DKYEALRPIFNTFAILYDAIITPSSADDSLKGLYDMGDVCLKFSSDAMGLHTPVIRVPAFAGTNGMSVGLSIVAAKGLDQRLLQVAKRIGGALMIEGSWRMIEGSE